MKTILVPTDFSECARNAAEYAATLATYFNAHVVLLHVYQEPVYMPESPIIVSDAELLAVCRQKLEEEASHIRQNFDDIAVECRCLRGYAVPLIAHTAKELAADLIVAGIHGMIYLEERLVGSTATSLISRPVCPVLIIGLHMRFKSIHNIVLACDYEPGNKTDYSILLQLAPVLGVHIHILNIVKNPEDAFSIEHTVEQMKIGHLFKDINHTFHRAYHKDITEGIQSYIIEHAADMLVMQPKPHEMPERLFRRPYTDYMSFHSAVPVLSIPEL